MTLFVARRSFLSQMFSGVAVGLAPSGARRPGDSAPSVFPQQDPEVVQAVVGASHSDLDRVRELVDARPALARATWDWGFGDWESALGAASHTGRREIAEYLIRMGARPNLFTAAMMGQLAVVRALVEAQPGVEAIPGPHGITLLAHARAGGEPARAVVDYLEGLGSADPRPLDLPLSDAERAARVGTYGVEGGTPGSIEIAENRGQLTLSAEGGTRRMLFHRGDDLYHPAGAPAVAIRLYLEGGTATWLDVSDGPVSVTARRRP